jgi:GxxExxY protein
MELQPSNAAEPVENQVATEVIGAAIEVHRHLGPGMIESAYELALSHELALRKLTCRRQLSIAARYKHIDIPDAYRIDLMVEESVVVEIKAVESLLPVHEAQLLTYLRFTEKRLGLLLNFHAFPMKAGIRRVANKL